MPSSLPDQEKNAATLLQTLSCLLKEDDTHRVSLAQLLHKEVAGGLVAGVSLGEMVRHELAQGGDPAKIGGLLATLDSNLRQTLQIVRDMTEDLFPPVLKAFGLNVALQQLVRGLAETFAGSLVLHINGDEPALDLTRRLNLFRITQSLLRHCVRHANTSWVEVTCRTSAGRLEIIIDHDGSDSIWKDRATDAELAVAEARCLLLGSSLQVISVNPGGCSRVTVMALSPAPQTAT